MKTTLIIPDPLFKDLKRRAAEGGETLSQLVTELLRKGLSERPRRKRLPPLPTFRTGPAKVDIAGRDALYRAMEIEEEADGVRCGYERAHLCGDP